MRRMRGIVAFVTVVAMWMNVVGAVFIPPMVTRAEVLSPSSFVEASAKVELFPRWFGTIPQASVAAENRPAPRLYGPMYAPVPRPLQRDIPLSLLTVQVIGPDVLSLGGPLGAGEVFTAVVHNTSTEVAYSVYLTATHPAFFIHDGGDQLLSPTGTIPINVVDGAGVITWTPQSRYDLTPGGTITLNFKLRATCSAESGKRLEVGIRYNADPPPATPDELNYGGLNVTTGRGNLVIWKDPAIQNIGSIDYGKPITWIVKVQNTGLGKLYDAIITDTGGVNLSQPSGDLNPSTTIAVLGINQVQTYTVVGRVEACNLTNVAQGVWVCGNQEGDGVPSNPVESTASVLFSPQLPKINLDVSSPITCPYCTPVTHTVIVTIDNSGGPAGDFRLDSGLESDSFWELISGSVSSDWQYSDTNGIFTYVGGAPVTGTVAAQTSGLTLTFRLRPRDNAICSSGSGSIAFEALYNDVCSGEPYPASPATLRYEYAQGAAPSLAISKDAPEIVTSGEVFTYRLTASGENAAYISGSIRITDVLPAQFVLIGPVLPSAGVTQTNGQTLTWQFDPGSAAAFSETLTYRVRAITLTDACGAGQIVQNDAQAVAFPICAGCPPLTATTYVRTAIGNSDETVRPGNEVSNDAAEVCSQGIVIANRYLITGSSVVTWAGTVFTESLGRDIGGAGHLPGPAYLQYRSGSLSVTINGVSYTSYLTPDTSTGPLVIDFSPLQGTGAPTQHLLLRITYTVDIPEEALNGAASVSFHDWTQLFLPGVSDANSCAGNRSYNQVLLLTLERGDLSLSLSPQTLNRCRTNPVVITVHDNAPSRLTDQMVVTFTSSITEIRTARNFTYTGSLAAASTVTVVTSTAGSSGIVTFTFPPDFDLQGNGEIRFEVNINCRDSADWHAGVTYLSRCDLAHAGDTSLSHTYRKPNLLLFVTPIEYTVRQREVTWKFFVANNGNLTATNVLVTNIITGLAVSDYQDDGRGGITLSGTLPITDPDRVYFTIAEIAPYDQREVTVTADVIQCTPLHVTILAEQRCFNTLCKRAQAEVRYNTPDPYLLTNNGETADLPMCDPGEIIFTTKNASPDVALYTVDITETLSKLVPVPGAPMTVTIVDDQGGTLAQTTGFTPQMVYSGTDLLLVWRAVSAASTAVHTWFEELPPLHIIRIKVPVRTSCVPPNTPHSFASASALGPCGRHLGYTEDSVTLQTLQPDMEVVKDGHVDGEMAFDDDVYVEPNQTLVWRLQVYNHPTNRSYVAHNVVLSDAWPTNFSLTSYTTGYTPTVDYAAHVITWEIGDFAPQVSPLVFYLTGTVTGGSCVTPTENNTRLTFGCDNDGCTSDVVPQDSARLHTLPDLGLALAPDPWQACGGDLLVTINSYGSRAYSNRLTITLPSGYVYSETVSVSDGMTPTQIISTNGTPAGAAPVFLWDEIPGRPTGSSAFSFDMRLRVRSVDATGTCPLAGSYQAVGRLLFDSHALCTAPDPKTVSDTATVNVRNPALEVTKSPRTQTADTGDVVTWTLTVRNTGTGVAEGVIVTDVVGDNYTAVNAGNGSDGATPTIVGNRVVWRLNGDLAASGGTWTAQVWAKLLSTGDNRNLVTATASCASGCTSASGSAVAYTTMLQEFEKSPDVQTGTVGSVITFALTASLPDQNALYENLTLTDALPVGLGYVASLLTYTYDGPASPTTVVSHTPTVTPGLYASGAVVWRLGDLSGTVQVNGILTAVLQNDPLIYDGARVTNVFTMTYTDSGQPYIYTDTAGVDALEPLLHVGKTYNTPSGCAATFLADTFNVPDTTASPFGNWSRVNNNVAIRDGMLYLYNSGDVENAVTLSDFSLSMMARRNADSSGDLWVIFRASGANYYNNSYRLEWTDTTLRLRKYVNGSGYTDITDIPGASAVLPNDNQWHHFEIRAHRSRIEIYADGVLKIAVTDTSHASGYTQIRTLAGSNYDVDDILVTRFGAAGCYVGANDHITYTIPVSNQARMPGYDLVITDSLPAGLSLVNYTLTSNDSSNPTVTAGPAGGATGDLVWHIDHLTPTAPFDPLAHTALTLTVVLAVGDGITANIRLPNQVALAYDAWPGSGQPTTITRDYSGGSHSTAVRTVNGTAAKAVRFSPPPTATLGTLVTYTITIPDPVITATLYDVLVTDTLDGRLSLEDVTTFGGTGPVVTRAGRSFTVTFDSVPHDTRAFVTVTARVMDALGAVAGDRLTNTAWLTHATADEITATNVVTTVIGEPRVHIAKQGRALTADPQTAVYTLTITNDGDAPAYSLIVTDSLPAGVTATAASSGGTIAPDGRTVTWTLAYLSNEPPGNTRDLTYTARLSQAIYVTTTLTNRAVVRSTSLTDTITGTREYTAGTDLPLHWPLGRLGDYVWYDFDYDGVQGSHGSEFSLAGVEIALFNGDTGAYIAATTTDASGHYIFEHLPLNVTYTVRISPTAYGPGGPLAAYTQTRYMAGGNPAADSNAAITQTFGGHPYAVTTTLTSAYTEDLTLDYGFVRLVEIGNYVWADDDYDGVQDEPAGNGFGGVTVTLTYPDGRVFTTTTNANGYYTFTVPVSMAYTIAVVAENFAPGGPLEVYTYTQINSGSDDALDSDGQPSGGDLVIHTPTITQDNYTFDFGLIRLVALGNLVWYDTGAGDHTNNGRVDSGESGVPNVEVQLFRQGDATPFLTTTTDANGRYVFDNLRPDTYYVHIPASAFQAGGPLAGYVSSVGNGSDETTDHTGDENGVDEPALATTGISSTVYVLFPGTETTGDDDTGYGGALDDDCVNLTADFGFAQLVALGNVVWLDTGAGAHTNNGLFDSDESGVPGVTVQLFRAGATGPVLTTTTDASGYYTFDLLIPGTYTVYLPAKNFQAGGPLVGYVSSVGNGTDESTDQDGDENGVDAPALATTGISSTVYILQPGTEITGENQSNYHGYLDDANVNFTADFGFVELVALGNLVWYDTGAGGHANNGIFDDDEVGVAGVEVQLFRAGVGVPVLTTTTDISGYYQFDNLVPGTYTVHIPASAFTGTGPLVGYVSSIGNGADESTDQDGDENGVDEPALAATGISSTVYVLLPNSERTGEEQSNYTGYLDDDNVNFTADFGFVELVALGNLVWYDTGAGDHTNNGIFDDDEVGVAGVEVQLFRADVGSPVLTTTTDISGYYQFDNLVPGTYTVYLPAKNFQAGGPLVGYVSSVGNGADESTDQDGDENGVDEPALATTGISSTVYVLSPNDERTGEDQSNYTGYLDDDNVNFTADFGFYTATLSLGDLVWFDGNNNGIFEPASGESGVAGVLMELYRAGDVPSATTALLTTTTNGAGRYLFSGLAEGRYFVHIPPSQFTSGEPLFGYESTVPTERNADNDQNEDVDENGIPVAGGRAAVAGVSSGIVTLTLGTEPIGEDVSGLDHTTPDENSNLTVDFGFYRITRFGLVVVKEVSPTLVLPGQPFTYTIRITNTGQSVISPLVITDTLPSPSLHYIPGSGFPTDPTTSTGQTLVWYIPTLAAGAATSITFAVTATPPISENLVNVVFVGGDIPTGTITDTGTTTITFARPSVEVVKQLTGRDWDDEIFTFTIRVRNDGPSTLDVIPLADDYDHRDLAFVRAYPYSPDRVITETGWLYWNDLTLHFGRNLPPGEQYVLTTTFVAVSDFTQTVNTAIITDATDINDNTADEDRDSDIITTIPTGITLNALEVVALTDGLRLTWSVPVAVNLYGFYLDRALVNQFDRAQRIAFIPGGGLTYAYVDTDIVPGQPYWYWLTVIDNDGGTARYGSVSAIAPLARAYHLYLPLIVRQ